MRSLLRTADLSPEDLASLLDMSDDVVRDPMRRRDYLVGEIVVIYMDKPSTRTRLSFDAAIRRLGGDTAVVGPDDLQLGRGESIEDTARTISRYAASFIIRTFSDADVRRFSSTATIPVVNALTDLHHPCQSVADLLTLRQRFGELRSLPVAYLGDGNNNVTHSLIEAAALAGMRLAVATPPGYEPDSDVLDVARAIAATTGAAIEVGTDPHAAVAGAAAVYADTWFSMGDPEAERARRLADLEPYRVDGDLMAQAAPEAIFMHCLPAYRGNEMTAAVIDGPQSVVFDQAENRMHTAQAIIVALLGRRLVGRTGTPEHGVFAVHR